MVSIWGDETIRLRDVKKNLKKKTHLGFFLWLSLDKGRLMMKKMLLLVLALSMVVGAANVWALPMGYLKLTSNGQTVQVWDGDSNDGYAAEGVVNYMGAVGAFGINVTTGLFAPAIDISEIDLNSVDVGGAGTLDIELTVMNFENYEFPAYAFQVGGTLSDNASALFNAYLNYGTVDEMEIASLNFENNNGYALGFSGSDGVSANVNEPYSLTILASITHNGDAFSVSSFDAMIDPVPEPATILLFGAGLIGLAAYGRRKGIGS